MARLLSEVTEYVFELDHLVVELVLELRSPLATNLMTSVTGLGTAAAAVVFLGIFYLAGWSDELAVATPALLLTGILVTGLMLTVQRAFPPHPVCMTAGTETVTSSFPSGHAASATVFALIARRSDALPFAPVGALAALIAVSRIYLGTHFLSDTIVGVLVGVMSFLVARRLVPVVREQVSRIAHEPR
jgi:membrane-associated phospholipid phosphatase